MMVVVVPTAVVSLVEVGLVGFLGEGLSSSAKRGQSEAAGMA